MSSKRRPRSSTTRPHKPRTARKPRKARSAIWVGGRVRKWLKKQPPQIQQALALIGLILVAVGIVLGYQHMASTYGAPRVRVIEIPEVPQGNARVWSLGTLRLYDAPEGEPLEGVRITVSESLLQLKREGAWSYVNFRGQRGYVESRYLTPLEPIQRAADVLEGVREGAPLTGAQQTELLAHLIYAEGGNQSRLCQVYIGSVVLNRVGGDVGRIEETIFQKGAFDVVSNRSILKAPSNEALAVARELVRYGSRLPEFVVYFHRYDLDTAWTRKVAIYVREDEVVFGYSPTDERVPEELKPGTSPP